MSYATPANIEGDFKNTSFTSTTLVTDSDVLRFIAESDALINSYVGTRYVVPITADADSLALMRLYSVTLTADRIKKILEVKQLTNTQANQDVRGAFGTADVMRALAAIQKGNAVLSGAVLAAGSSGVFYSDNAANGRTPEFSKDKSQW
jgi:phage gp36-like protein